MRQLHVVALSEDGRHVLLGTSKNATTATFRVPLDGRLTAAVKGELPRPGQTAAPVAALTPKEMQARLRAGETSEEIARSAGIPVARVERFAGPVEGEKARIVAAARLTVLNRQRRGPSAVPLGEAVDHHLAETSQLDPGSVVWNARKLEDGSWVVDVGYALRGRRKEASWRYTPSTRDLAAVDAHSSVLGYVDPEDRPKSVAAVSPTRKRRTAASSRASRSVAATSVPPAAKAPAAKKKKAKPAVAARVAQARPPARATAPAARVEPPAAKRPQAPPKVTPKQAAAQAEAPTPESPPQLRVVPPPVETGPRGRAVVPGWADVLLSTTPPARSSDPAED